MFFASLFLVLFSFLEIWNNFVKIRHVKIQKFCSETCQTFHRNWSLRFILIQPFYKCFWELHLCTKKAAQ
jgi:hypothetical protein